MVRRLLVLCFAAVVMSGFSAHASERLTYKADLFEAAVNAGKPVLVHITAPWCPNCKQQKPIVADLVGRPEFNDLTIFEVDFDTQKDALRRLKVQMQSTLLVFKKKNEVARAVGITSRKEIEAVVKQAL